MLFQVHGIVRKSEYMGSESEQEISRVVEAKNEEHAVELMDRLYEVQL
jgi:ribosomal protein L20A (L18A)